MRKIFVFVIVILFVSMLILGCEEQQASSSGVGSKRSRLVGAENIQLKNQLELCNKKLEKQRKKFAESERNCEAEKQEMKDNADKIGMAAINDFEKLVNLRKENVELKARIKELEK